MPRLLELYCLHDWYLQVGDPRAGRRIAPYPRLDQLDDTIKEGRLGKPYNGVSIGKRRKKGVSDGYR
jgi:hypothetical protein